MEQTAGVERELPKGLLKWYEFHREECVLYIGSRMDVLYEGLQERKEDGEIMDVDVKAPEDVAGLSDGKACHQKYDVVVVSDCFETCTQKEVLFKTLFSYLNRHGRLLVCAHNRLGIRYFCGDRDLYTGRNFDGIENYRKAAARAEDEMRGRMYDKAELSGMLQDAGFQRLNFYSVFPGFESPALIFSEHTIPNEALNTRCFPMYHYPDTVFLEEEYLYDSLIRNGMFHTMANAFLIECFVCEAEQKDDRSILQVTSSMDRGRENALFTIIYSNHEVEKRAVYPEGEKRLYQIMENSRELEKRGICVVPATMRAGAYIMPYVEEETALSYLRRLAYEDKTLFLDAMDRFRDCILRSSDIYEDESCGRKEVFFKKGFYDLVPLNCFVADGEYVFYDQEFVIENCPVGVVVSRLVDLVYQGEYEIEKITPKSELLARYGLAENIETYRSLAWKYVVKLRKENELRLFYEKTRRNPEIVEANRKRMNYSETEYERIFAGALKNIGNRSLILFGSGTFAKRFLAMYRKYYPVYTIIDNNPDRWGQQIEGIPIQPPDALKNFDETKHKVLICIKDYLSVARQLESLGITDYGVFDSSRSYARPVASTLCTPSPDSKPREEKKYHTGYVAGVFDMFHIGHVRLLQKAKEQCEYLIVGVVSDEDCYRQKDKYPVIPCEERMEVLKACKYVDQVEPLPTGFGGIRDAYKMFQFDVQFSGDDHGDEGNWLAEKEYLKKQGVDLVFFDYTKETSSTQIRKKVR